MRHRWCTGHTPYGLPLASGGAIDQAVVVRPAEDHPHPPHDVPQPDRAESLGQLRPPLPEVVGAQVRHQAIAAEELVDLIARPTVVVVRPSGDLTGVPLEFLGGALPV